MSQEGHLEQGEKGGGGETQGRGLLINKLQGFHTSTSLLLFIKANRNCGKFTNKLNKGM